MVKLFNAKSWIADGSAYEFTRDEIPDATNFAIDWFILQRRNEMVSADIFPNFGDLTDQEQEKVTQTISESFTEEEVNDLQAFLQERYAVETEISELTLTLQSALLYKSKFAMDAQPVLSPDGKIRKLEVVHSFLALADKPGYALDFDVRGFYNLEHWD